MTARVCIFGEVLFDHFPDGRRVLGGAPFNVAWNLAALGEDPLLLSRVGTDADGDSVRVAMQVWGLDTSGLQKGPGEHTGQVRVRIEDGEPAYDIVRPVAWDAIEQAESPPPCGLLYHGSLALRSARSRASLLALRAAGPQTVFVDVNLRDHWWDPGTVSGLLDGAHWAKFNEDELDRLAPPGDSPQARARATIERHGLQALLLTGGERGARLFTAAGEMLEARPGREVEVVDTVGAGDAFAAVVMLGILRDWPLQTSLDRAQAFASAVVGQRGATVHDKAFYAPFAAWHGR
ncbi:MAG: carbohydrate kinase [Xanthomonadales bacterium]|nr:carbohydrate kinase [Xanthomonadales bacterium]